MDIKRFNFIIIFIILFFMIFSCMTKKVENKITNNSKKKPMTGEKTKEEKQLGKIDESEYFYACDELSVDADTDLPYELRDREKYKNYGENPRTSPLVEPFSTFSIDVDTGSYANARRFLQKYGQLPPEDSVRIEEFINYFQYDYPIPDKYPFSIYHEIAVSPFDNDRMLLHVGIQGKKIPFEERSDSNLVFLIDVSGSMDSPDKLGLLKSSLILLTDQMTSRDKISIVVYAGAAGVILHPTSGNNKNAIKDALKRLTAGGSTAGSEGIMLAYKMAEEAFIEEGINRVILATDGDFNVGITDFNDLMELIEEKRKSGIALTTLGFGTGNYNDRLMEQLADKGNGNYYYIDNFNEAKKVLVEELASTLQIIAKDVKIQIEFNPKYVASYRLIGYENRMLKKEDFDNDVIDAGEIGAGHTVTAIYEITLAGSKKDNEGSRYKNEGNEIKDKIKTTDTNFNNEIAFFRLRYKNPDEDKSNLIESPLLITEITRSNPSNDFLFSAAVAHFAQILRKSKYIEDYDYNNILTVIKKSKGDDKWGYKQELETLVKLAKGLSG